MPNNSQKSLCLSARLASLLFSHLRVFLRKFSDLYPKCIFELHAMLKENRELIATSNIGNQFSVYMKKRFIVPVVYFVSLWTERQNLAVLESRHGRTFQVMKEKAKNFLVPSFVVLGPGTVVFHGISGKYFKTDSHFHCVSLCIARYYI